jgi:hypothetical protein
MRKAIRDAGPYSTGMLTGDLKSRKYEIESVSQEAKEAIVAALNAVASESEQVAVAREALLRQLAKYPLEGGVSKVDLNAIAKYRRAIVASRREALRAKQARK